MVAGSNLLFAKSGVKKIRPGDEELSRVQDNLGNTLESVLGHLNEQQAGYQQAIFAPSLQKLNPNVQALSVARPGLFVRGRPDGSFQINQPTVQFGEPAYRNPQGSLNAQLDSCLFSWGQIVAFGSQAMTDGFVIIPQVSGPAFRVAPNNSYTAFQINFDGSAGCTGPFNAASIRSDAGIKSWLPGMHYWNPNYGGGFQTLVIPVVQTASGTVSTTPWGMSMTRVGSVVGISASQTGPASVVCAVAVFKNGAQLLSANVSSGNGSGQVAFPKGTYPFVAGDYLTARINYSLAGVNVCTQVAIEVEEVA